MNEVSRFQDKMSAYDLDPGQIQADGNIHRFPTWGDRSGETSGAYWHNGRVGWFQDWRTMEKPEVIKGKLSEADKAALARSFNGGGQKVSREALKTGIRKLWDAGTDPGGHPYLEKKQIKPVPQMKQYDGRLIIPVFGIDGEMNGLQRIDADGRKRFLAGTRKKGSFYSIAGSDDTYVICEGVATGISIHQATGYSVAVAFDAGNLERVAEAFCKKVGSDKVIIAGDNDSWKAEAGQKDTGTAAATKAAKMTSAAAVMPAFERPDGKRTTDFNDLANFEGLEAVRTQIQAAKPINKIDALKAEIEKILKLDPLEQEIERSRLTKEYDIRKSAIDQYICHRSKNECDYKAVVEEVEPAADPVDGEKLLNGILARIQKRVVLPDGAPEAVTLWTMLTYCYDAFNVLPILGVVSPTKRCGKSTLIEILQALSSKGLAASNMTPAALFRTIEKYTPTLLIDEADTFLKENDELRGVINSGHTRALAFVVRVEGDNHEPKKFSTWGPKAIGMIGTLPDTIEDRSIVIQLRRKVPGEKIIKTGLDFAEKSVGIRARCRRWANDNLTRLKAVSVPLPSSGNDRADDNWTPLFTIAHIVGGDWPEKVRESMHQLVNISGDDAIGTKLLSDIRVIFQEDLAERIFSKDLVESLKELSESPWADWNRGKGLSTNGLSRLLKPFGIQPKTIRIDLDRYKGYTLQSFQDAFNRYIPRDPNVTPCQYNDFNNLDENAKVTQNYNVTDENQDNQLNLLTCHDVTDKKQDTGDLKEYSPCQGCQACDKNTLMCHAETMFEGKSGGGIPCKDAIKTCEYNKE